MTKEVLTNFKQLHRVNYPISKSL